MKDMMVNTAVVVDDDDDDDGVCNNRVYAQPFYVLRKTKFYAAVKKGVCAPSYEIPKLYLHL
jgi:hypothetical protein